jgi:hypothetical protein
VAHHVYPKAALARLLPAMQGERDPVRLHDRALGELIPANEWRELS